MKTGEIILIPFPFAELTTVKVRPALVVSETADKHKDIIICAISSVIREPLSVNEIKVQPSELNGLRKPSVLKVDRIVTIKAEKLIAKLGLLEDNLLKEFREKFRALPN